MSFFVDEELLTNCLQRAHPGSTITIENYEDGEYVVEPGTNYSSEIIRVWVEYQYDQHSRKEFLIFKIPFLNAHFDYLNKLGFYDKETYMYNAVLPAMVEMLDSAIVPKHYFTTDRHVIALEDLTAQGYYLLKRASFEYEHCAQTFRGLAQFHATSVKLHLQDGHILQAASHEALYTKTVVSQSMRACYPVLLDALRMEKVPSTALAAFAAFEARINDSDICQLSKRLHEFNVLNHGDLKTNNILFKDDERSSKPVSVKLLDYQTCRWNSPVLDLIFFNMATMDYAVYNQHYDQLLKLYLHTLNETLSKLGCRCAYTEEEYESDMEACKLFQVFTLVWIGFLDIREAIRGFDYHKIIQLEQDELEKVRKNKMFQRRFLKWFRHFEKQGFFS